MWSLKSILIGASNTLLCIIDKVFNIKPLDNPYLTSLVDAFNPRNLDNLNRNFGGIEGVVSGLNSNESTGIHGDSQDLSLRHHTSGPNTYPQIPKRSISQLMLAELNHTFRLTQLICVYWFILLSLVSNYTGLVMMDKSFIE